jgi:hypothetical protein
MSEKVYMWIIIILTVLLFITTYLMDRENTKLKGYLDDTCKLFNNLADVTNTCTKNLGLYDSINYDKITPLTCYDDI